MNLLQIITAALFFYVFGLGAILLTWYTVKSIGRYIQEGQGHHNGAKNIEPPDIGNEHTKLHISGGLLEVNRLPDEEQEKP